MINAGPRIKAYYELCKPRVVMLMILTAVVGMVLASPGWVPGSVLLWASLGIGLMACGAAVLNQLLERHLDALMQRTMKRPIVLGAVSPQQALIFSSCLSVSGFCLLWFGVNNLAALLTLATLVGYAGFYTLILKPLTPQNIVIGGLAGATPPLLGWVSVTGEISAYSLLPVIIIYLWTPPHFWALAIHRYEEYAKANIPMLPVTHGIPFTKLSIVLYIILLLLSSVLPTIVGMSGWFYAVVALLLGAGFLYHGIKLYRSISHQHALTCFHYSILYLSLLFLALCLDHAMG